MNLLHQHAAKLESIADEMQAAGIGGDPNNGYAVVLRKMAGYMRADAAQGRMPSVHAGASTRNSAVACALSACRDAGVAVPASGRFTLEALNSALDAAFPANSHPMAWSRRIELKNQIAAAGMLIEEPVINAKVVQAAGRMLAKAGIPIPTHVFTLDEINAELDKTKLSPGERIALKDNLMAAGLMERQGVAVPLRKPGINVARSIFAQLGIDEPKQGQKVSLGKLNAAMAEKGYDIQRKITTKAALHAAGLLQD
jgi:hypothetical protein